MFSTLLFAGFHNQSLLLTLLRHCFKRPKYPILSFSFFFLIQEPYKFNKNVPPEICQNIKNMLRTYPRLREEQFIFQWFYFPKSRKAEFLYVTYVLHKVRVRVKVISLNTFILCMVNNTFPLYLYNSLI